MPVRTVLVILYLITLISIIIVTWRKVCVRMSVQICSVLLAFVLSCNVLQRLHWLRNKSIVVVERHGATLPCPRTVKGSVTWSRDHHGAQVKILTIADDGDIRYNDPGKRYNSLADKSLHIQRAVVSDSGRYFCDNEPAVDLTVIPPGTPIGNAPETTSITLTCPGRSNDKTWRREVAGRKETIRGSVSRLGETLPLPYVQLDDSGLYYCGGGAVYLNVTTKQWKHKTTTTNNSNSNNNNNNKNNNNNNDITRMRIKICSVLLAFVLSCNVSAGMLTPSTTTTTTSRPPPTTTTTTSRPPPPQHDITTTNNNDNKNNAINKNNINNINNSDTNNNNTSVTLWKPVTQRRLMPVRTVLVILYLITMISIIVVTQRKVCVRMRIKICSVLLAFVLSCNVSAGIKSIVVEERHGVNLPCPQTVEGSVTWSREINGAQVKILTTAVDGDIRYNDPGKRYSSLADKSLHIQRAKVSDSGRYFCNNEPAVDLTVIPPGAREDQGTTLLYRVLIPFLLLLLIIIFIICYFTLRSRSKRRGTEDLNVYEEIQEVPVCQLSHVCVKMRIKISSVLLAFVLGCNVCAGIKSIVVVERHGVTLPCPQTVEGSVTWSREINGTKDKILTTAVDGDIRYNDPGKRYSSLADKSLHIQRVVVSDSGRCFCNNEPAVDLTVIPPGTEFLNVTVRHSTTLMCPAEVFGSNDPKWVRRMGDKNNTVRTQGAHIKGKILTLTDIQRNDSGLYSCNNKSVAYLNVLEDKAAPTIVLVLGVVVPLVLIIVVIILFLVWRCKFKTRAGHSEQEAVIYADIIEESMFKCTQDESSQIMYTTIKHLQPAGNNNVIPFSVPEDHQICLRCGDSDWSQVVWTHQDRQVLVTRQGSYETNRDRKRYILLSDGGLCVLLLDDSDKGLYRCNQLPVAELQVLT
ncbi:hypothetical protein INR49_005925, partial [Caranx melampygus]